VNKKYLVDVTDEERAQLKALTAKRTVAVRRYKRAQALLGAAAGETDPAIGARVGLHHVTIEGIRKRFVEEGLESALSERSARGLRPVDLWTAPRRLPPRRRQEETCCGQ
jgi:hypothetical protein